jgi:hypothetical protein
MVVELEFVPSDSAGYKEDNRGQVVRFRSPRVHLQECSVFVLSFCPAAARSSGCGRE